MSDGATPPAAAPVDPGSLLQSKDYRVLLVLAAAIGVVVSVASWAFLELIHYTQQWVYKELPGDLGFAKVPVWWPVPVLAVAGVIVAFAIVRLPGTGGHQPAEGVKAAGPHQTGRASGRGTCRARLGRARIRARPGGSADRDRDGACRLRRPLREEGRAGPGGGIDGRRRQFRRPLLAAPIVGAVIIIEAAGLGGPTLPVILLPGLLAAGIGSLVFIGMGSLTGLSTSAYAISPLALPAYREPTVPAFAWTIVLAVAVAVVVFLILQIGRQSEGLAVRRPFVVIPVAALVVAGLAIAFGQITGKPANLVLFSGQDGMGQVVNQAATLSVSTLALLIVFKGLAYGVSLGSARGGPTFRAMFLGIVGGLLASHLSGFAETPAVAALMGAATVSVLGLPLSSVILALVVSQAGLATAPLIIVAVVVAFITVRVLAARHASRAASPAPPVGGDTRAVDDSTPGPHRAATSPTSAAETS